MRIRRREDEKGNEEKAKGMRQRQDRRQEKEVEKGRKRKRGVSAAENTRLAKE